MEVILREEIEKLGTPGQLVKVKAGYARNFLIPRKLAVPATAANKKMVEEQRAAWLRKEAKLKTDAEELGKLMSAVSLTFARKAGEEDHLFGSVTSADIAEGLKQHNYNVERRRIHLPDPIKTLGEHKVPVRVHKDVTVDITVTVVKED
jgi:large subunit ribosomal protein L9